MKTTRRILSMVLALMMILSLSVTAFADTPATPYINVTVKNSRSGSATSWTVAATTGESVKSALDADTAHAIGWNTVQDYYDATKTHSALASYGGFATTKFDSTVARDRANLAKKGYNYSTITWYTGALQGYGLIKQDGSNYTYIYAGYDWTYSSNKSTQIWDYMCCYNVQADEVVELVYDFTVSVWTTTTPLA